MYRIVEIDRSGNEIGIVYLNDINVTSGMKFYWNKKLNIDSQICTTTIFNFQVEKIYKNLKNKFPDKEFEIRGVLR